MAERVVEPDLYEELDVDHEAKVMDRLRHQQRLNKSELWNANPKCDHDVWSPPGGGIACRKCPGWMCL